MLDVKFSAIKNTNISDNSLMKPSISIEDLVRKEVIDLNSYHVENIPCEVVLDANENPFPIPEFLKGEIRESFNNIETNRYPDSRAQRLKAVIAARDGIPADQVLVGNGSDEIIQMILTVFCPKEGRVIFPAPTFSMYALITKAWGGISTEVPLNSDWDLDLSLFFEKIEQERPSVAFFSTPNNPTGNCISRDKMIHILENFGGIVVIDEAYFHFSDETFLDFLENFPNIIILRSLSKIGMAGLRLGYCVASEKIIGYLNRVRLPYNINSFSQVAAEVILNNWNILGGQIEQLQKERMRVFHSMEKIKDILPFPSKANFILFRLAEDEEPEVFFKKLIDKGIRIRNLSNVPFLKRCFRVTIGTQRENDVFLAALSG